MLSAFVNLMLALPFPGGEVLGLIFAGSVLLASQSPYPIYDYFLANITNPILFTFLENVMFATSTWSLYIYASTKSMWFQEWNVMWSMQAYC